jgi:hypothetical protein
MQLKTIPKRVQKFRSFVHGRILGLDSGTILALLFEMPGQTAEGYKVNSRNSISEE